MRDKMRNDHILTKTDINPIEKRNVDLWMQ